MVYLGGFTISPCSSCLLCIAFHSHDKHKNMEDVIIPSFYRRSAFYRWQKSIPTKPCCLFIVSQYVSWRIQTLEFYFDRYLEATIFFLEWKYLSEKWHVGKKQNCFARCSAPSPWSSLYFRSIVVGQKYSWWEGKKEENWSWKEEHREWWY